MGRTKLVSPRPTATLDENLGNVLIFCEGITEQQYFDYFAAAMKKVKYNNVTIETQPACGNSRAVYKFAENFFKKDLNRKQYMNYRKYLVFDCDAPQNIQKVITDMEASQNHYRLLLSNYLFELWLLMHFEYIDHHLSKPDIYKHLKHYLNGKYEKANSGIIKEIIESGDVEEAVKNGYTLSKKYMRNGMDISSDIKDMNPYTSVHELVEQFLLQIN